MALTQKQHLEIWGQFHQPIGTKHKFTGAGSLVQKMPYSFTNKTNLNRSYTHFSHSIHYAAHQKDQYKSTVTKAAHKMLVKLKLPYVCKSNEGSVTPLQRQQSKMMLRS